MQGVEEEVGEEVEKSAEVGFKEVAKSSEESPKTSQTATGTVVGGPTRAEVASWVDARMRNLSESPNDAICAAVEDNFGDAWKMMEMDLEDEYVGTDFYKIIRRVVEELIEDRRIRDTMTQAKFRTVCTDENIDRIATKLTTSCID